MKKQLLAGAVAAAFAAGGLAHAANGNMNSDAAGTMSATKASNSPVSHYSLMELTPQQKKTLYQAASGFEAQSLPQKQQGHEVIAGTKLPSGVSLKSIPQSVQQQFNGVNAKQVQNFKLAKVQGGDVLVVNPKNRRVEAVITEQEANGQTGSTVGEGSSQDSKESTNQGTSGQQYNAMQPNGGMNNNGNGSTNGSGSSNSSNSGNSSSTQK